MAKVITCYENGTLKTTINTDIQVSSPDTGQVLTYNATNSRWENQYPQYGFSVQSVQSTNYNADAWQYVPCDITSNNVTVTLPDATIGNGIEVGVKVAGVATNTLTIATVSSQTIDNSNTKALTTDNASMIVISNGSNWYIK